MSARPILSILLTSCLLVAATAAAQHAATQPGAASGAQSGNAEPGSEPREFVTQHTIDVDGEPLRYTAVAEETYLKGDDGTPKAGVFTISYFKDGVDDPAARPLTFLFNGGPGSSAVWLHLGAFGPMQLDLGPDPLDAGAPPYRLRANPHTLLTHSDLVFVDPVGTGYSRPLGESKGEEYWGVDEDSSSIAQFIRAFLTHHKRWKSPKYLAGESYGTIRASLLIRDLSLAPLNGVAFNGVILLSAALDVRIFMSGAPGNELIYVTHLPTYAATAHYHDQLPDEPADLEAFLQEAREFAATEYLTALFQGDSLPESRAAEIAAKLHRYSGLSVEFLRRSKLRVGTGRFLKELLRDRSKTLAVHDTRFLGQDLDDAGEFVDWDPFMTAMAGPFVTMINSYLEDGLGVVDMGREYEVFSMQARGSWKRAQGLSGVFAGYLHTAPYLAQAAAANKDFRVFVATGYHDLTTTMFGVEYTFDHSGIDKDRLTLKNYYGGHMMYLYEPSLEEMSGDIRAFFGDS